MMLHLITDALCVRTDAKRRKEAENDAQEKEMAFLNELHTLGERIAALEECTEAETLREDIDRLEKRFREMEDAILPDDSSARKAKEQIDAFNEGVYNILSYHGSPKKRAEVIDDEDDEADA